MKLVDFRGTCFNADAMTHISIEGFNEELRVEINFIGGTVLVLAEKVSNVEACALKSSLEIALSPMKLQDS